MTSGNSTKPGNGDSSGIVFEPAPHLNEGSIVEYELKTALALQSSMEEGLQKLKKKTSKEHVHKSRVALRRWFSVWSLLQEEGWDSEEFSRKQMMPLKTLLKAMGALRDLDVAIDKAELLQCTSSMIKKLRRRRTKKENVLSELLKGISPLGITQEIEVYLHCRAEVMGKTTKLSPYEVLDEYLKRQEQKVKKLARKAATPEALHKTRLGIKKWRYLLTECMGLTNFDLVNAQTLLGEMHDLDRLELMLRKRKQPDDVFKRLKTARAELFREWMRTRDNLPYGLRPGISTLKA